VGLLRKSHISYTSQISRFPACLSFMSFSFYSPFKKKKTNIFCHPGLLSWSQVPWQTFPARKANKIWPKFRSTFARITAAVAEVLQHLDFLECDVTVKETAAAISSQHRSSLCNMACPEFRLKSDRWHHARPLPRCQPSNPPQVRNGQ